MHEGQAKSTDQAQQAPWSKQTMLIHLLLCISMSIGFTAVPAAYVAVYADQR
jgi:hypothetical protein